jgi:hypothetical protein
MNMYLYMYMYMYINVNVQYTVYTYVQITHMYIGTTFYYVYEEYFSSVCTEKHNAQLLEANTGRINEWTMPTVVKLCIYCIFSNC